MKVGFPRPRVEYDGKKYPAPYNTNDDELVSVNHNRASRCREKNMCGMCGQYVKARELAMYALVAGNISDPRRVEYAIFTEDSGPYHIKCAHLIAAHCPMVAIDEDSFAYGQDRYFFAPGVRKDAMTYLEYSR